jgi:hypothetical protein
MSWAEKPSYPPGALHTITIRCTEAQKSRWEAAAKRYNRGSRGAFVAWAADIVDVALDSFSRVCADHDREMQGANYR